MGLGVLDELSDLLGRPDSARLAEQRRVESRARSVARSDWASVDFPAPSIPSIVISLPGAMAGDHIERGGPGLDAAAG